MSAVPEIMFLNIVGSLPGVEMLMGMHVWPLIGFKIMKKERMQDY
jgi:hypothetical protein